MRVLWFTNTPSLAEEKLTSRPVGGGWIKSLEKNIKLHHDIELGIAFLFKEDISQFDYKGTKYFPVYTNRGNRVDKYIRKFNGNYQAKHTVKKYLTIVKEFKPDLIHIHGTEESFGLIQEETKIPVIISIQGNITTYEYKFFSGISFSTVKKHSSLKNKLLMDSYLQNFKKFQVQGKRERRILSTAKNIIGRTNWDRRISSVLAPKREYFHNDEILRDSFYDNQWGLEFSLPLSIITTTGNSLYKGLETIIYTAQLLDKSKIDFKWKIAGLNKNDNLVKLACNGLSIKLSENLVFLGKLNEKSLLNELLNSHLYIMPSHIENSPNSLCEAMILGLPCIATDVGGTSSLLENGKDGILIQDGDPWSMAGTIIEMMNDFEICEKYGAKARAKARARHNPTKITKDLLNIYHKII